MLEGWEQGGGLEAAARVVYPKLRAATQAGSVFMPLAHILTAGDEARILAWFREKNFATLRQGAGSLDGYVVGESSADGSAQRTLYRRDMVGLFLLALSTFVAARELADATIWPQVRTAIGGEGIDALIGPLGLTEAGRDALGHATRTFGLPSAPPNGDVHRFYQTVRLNTGASRDDLPRLISWFREPNLASRWFQRWRAEHPRFATFLQRLAQAGTLTLPLERDAKALFPLLDCTAESFATAPSASKASQLSVTDACPALPLRLAIVDGFHQLFLDLLAWKGAASATLVSSDLAIARKLGSSWKGAVDGRWLRLGLARSPSLEVDGVEASPFPAEMRMLFFSAAGDVVPSGTDAHTVLAWEPLVSSASEPDFYGRTGAWVARLEGTVETDAGERIFPLGDVASAVPPSSAGSPRVVSVEGTIDALQIRVAAASADHVLLEARVGAVVLEKSGEGHEVVFRGAVPPVVSGGFLRLLVRWREPAGERRRTLDVTLPQTMLVVDGEWRVPGGSLEASSLRRGDVVVAIGGQTPPSFPAELSLVCGRVSLGLRDHARRSAVWGAGEPLSLARRSPHDGGIVAELAATVVDHGRLEATSLPPQPSRLMLVSDFVCEDAWVLVWERDGSLSSHLVETEGREELAAGACLGVRPARPRPRAVALCRGTARAGAVWADDWDEGLCELASSDDQAREVLSTMLTLRLPALASAEVSRLLALRPLAIVEWASGDETDANASFDVQVPGTTRRLAAPHDVRAVLRELSLDLRLGAADVTKPIAKLPKEQQPKGFDRMLQRLVIAGPRPAAEFGLRPNWSRQVRAALAKRDWTSINQLGRPACERELKKEAKQLGERAMGILTLSAASSRLAALQEEASAWLQGNEPLPAFLRSAVRLDEAARHFATQHILRSTGTSKP